MLRVAMVVFLLSLGERPQARTQYNILAAAAARPAHKVRADFKKGEKAATWRATTEAELRKVIPARAPVIAERIETEFRTASGVTNGRGRFVAGVVLITAGYSAEGKYSNFLIAQVPLRIGGLALPAGQYVFGWTRSEESLAVRFYNAATGKELGTVAATHDGTIKRVESFRIRPPGENGVIQLGRFAMPYTLGP